MDDRSQKRARTLIVHSGGAKGADSNWCRQLKDQTDFHVFGFQGFYPPRMQPVRYHNLSTPELQEGMETIVAAVKSLGKRLTSSDYGRRFLQRDYHIVKDVDAVYAIGKMNPGFTGLGVDGGTGVGCQMYWNQGGRNLFFFDQQDQQWKKPDESGKWQALTEVPSLFSFTKIACIGSRDVSVESVKEIEKVSSIL